MAKYIPDSPAVTIDIRVLSGLSNEGQYAASGVSHFLEHLLFKGTNEMTSEEISDKTRKLGGIINGFTGLDSAGYYITVPNENFDEALSLITDMVMDPVFSDKEMETERQVILKEIKLHEDDPERDLSRRLFSEAYGVNVYRYPVIGYEERFKKLTRDDLRAYHAGVYVPDRLVVGIAGGIPSEEAIESARAALKGYERGKRWIIPEEQEPRQLGSRLMQVPADVNIGYIAVGFHGVSLFSDDMYPMDVASILLGGGRDSRLHQSLVRDKELLYGVSCSNITPRYPGLFVIAGQGDPDKLKAARDEIFAVINELKTGGINVGEVERAKSIVSANYLRAREEIDRVTSIMASSRLLTGDADFYEKYVEKIKETDGEQVLRAAERYLGIDNSTTVELVPKSFETREEARDPYAMPADEEKMHILRNGLKVVIKRRARLPIVSATIAFSGGLLAEDRENNGIAGLTSSLLLKGSRSRDENEIVPVFERMGGDISAFSGWNSMGVAMGILSEDIDKALDVFCDVVLDPAFSPEEIRRLKENITASINEQDKDIFEKGVLGLRELLYGDHPYAMRIDGTAETLNSITRKDILKFYKEHFLPDGAVLTIVGDVDPKTLIKKISAKFNGWKGKEGKLAPREIGPLERVEKKVLEMDKKQALVLVGFQGVDAADSRKYVLSVAGSMLSGGGGILFQTIREDQGLAYNCGAVNRVAVDPGYFMFYAGTTEENIQDVERSIFKVIEKIRAGDISEGEIASAKNRLLTSYASSLETNSSLAMIMTLDELYGLGFQNYKEYPDKIRGVTREDMISCAGEIMDPVNCAVVVVHSEEAGKEK
ncbi:MAG: insulinase family protein [Candidatus Omnitrophica bacterium]|nr:insulinase family protein [Candidatus Omnitrophota bacterium]MBU1128668.1 insulinase family protein [Candidatus Omnitrophota bacterium]MBU1784903.1 insulinase family protein [Candidatus Omnitrophota bacterium]MBU1852202.1 insulinase family protein [Candidatus Omnitrophota bacterium]